MKIWLFLLLAIFLSFNSSAASLLYVPMGNANDLVIIDLNTDKIIGRIDELENAHGLSSSPATEYLVAGSMKPVESSSPESMDKPKSISDDEHDAHHKSDDSKKVKNSPSYISIVHPKHGHVMRRIPVRGLSHHTAVSPDGKMAVAVHSGAAGISVIDLNSMQVIKTLDTGQWPNYAVFSTDGLELYVSNAGDNTVTEIDSINWIIKRQLKTGKEPEHIVLAPSGKSLYVANKGDGTTQKIDLLSGNITKTYKTGKKNHGIDVSDDGRWLFVVSKKENKITRVNLKNHKLKTADLGPAPYHLDYIDGFNKIYVSSRIQAKIWVIDPSTLAVQATIDLGKGIAHQMLVRDQ